MKDKKKEDFGSGKAPGRLCVMPQWAVVDERFKKHPVTFRVFAILCNYTSRTGICWPNQITIGKFLKISQSGVSKHITRLIKWDMVRYARKHPGLKGNKYFVKYDPDVEEDEAKAMVTAQDRPDEKPELTVGPKGSIPSKEYSSKGIVATGNTSHSVQGIHNTPSKSIYSNTARNIMNTFVRLTEEIFGRLIQYNFEQEQTATKYVQDGLTLEKAQQVIRKGLMHMRNNNMEPPRTIYWFEKAFFPNRYKQLKNMNTNEVINKLAKKLRVPR